MICLCGLDLGSLMPADHMQVDVYYLAETCSPNLLYARIRSIVLLIQPRISKRIKWVLYSDTYMTQEGLGRLRRHLPYATTTQKFVISDRRTGRGVTAVIRPCPASKDGSRLS